MDLSSENRQNHKTGFKAHMKGHIDIEIIPPISANVFWLLN
jgi:hypothetical protein